MIKRQGCWLVALGARRTASKGWTNMPEGMTVTAVDWIGMILLCFVLPLVLTWAIGKAFRAKGLIKEGDLKIDLG